MRHAFEEYQFIECHRFPRRSSGATVETRAEGSGYRSQKFQSSECGRRVDEVVARARGESVRRNLTGRCTDRSSRCDGICSADTRSAGRSGSYFIYFFLFTKGCTGRTAVGERTRGVKRLTGLRR